MTQSKLNWWVNGTENGFYVSGPHRAAALGRVGFKEEGTAVVPRKEVSWRRYCRMLSLKNATTASRPAWRSCWWPHKRQQRGFFFWKKNVPASFPAISIVTTLPPGKKGGKILLNKCNSFKSQEFIFCLENQQKKNGVLFPITGSKRLRLHSGWSVKVPNGGIGDKILAHGCCALSSLKSTPRISPALM